MEKKFQKGEVIWAKVRGFPWWPGLVKKIITRVNRNDISDKENKIIVNFIGDNSHAELPTNKIDKFAIKFDEYSKTKNRMLLNSIQTAQKIISGEISSDKIMTNDKENVLYINLA
jgi:hypothetical protein